MPIQRPSALRPYFSSSGNPGSDDRRVVPGRSSFFHAPRRAGLGPVRLQGHLEPRGVRRQEAGGGGEGASGGDEGAGGGGQRAGHGAAEDPPCAEARPERAAAGPETGAGAGAQGAAVEAEGARPQTKGATADKEVADAAEGKPQTGTCQRFSCGSIIQRSYKMKVGQSYCYC